MNTLKNIQIKNTCVILSIITWCFLIAYPFAANGTTFTLSDSALMSLDYDFIYYFGQSVTMTSITDVPGTGVIFDFSFPDPHNLQGEVPELFWTSCIYGGHGILTQQDISAYNAFALKITMISATGMSAPDEVGMLGVGALINQSQHEFAYQPQGISLNDPQYPPSAISVTPTDSARINLIGFTAYIPYWMYSPSSSNPWDPTGAKISLLVEPAPGAVVITPEPVTLFLFGLGAAMLRRKR